MDACNGITLGQHIDACSSLPMTHKLKHEVGGGTERHAVRSCVQKIFSKQNKMLQNGIKYFQKKGEESLQEVGMGRKNSPE